MRPFSLVRPLCPFGGDEEDRTPDPLLAKQVLSQLSYTPTTQSVEPPRCQSLLTYCVQLGITLLFAVSSYFVREPFLRVFLFSRFLSESSKLNNDFLFFPC